MAYLASALFAFAAIVAIASLTHSLRNLPRFSAFKIASIDDDHEGQVRVRYTDAVAAKSRKPAVHRHPAMLSGNPVNRLPRHLRGARAA